MVENPKKFELTSLAKQAEQICQKVSNKSVLGQYFTTNHPWSDRKWETFNYWNGFYALAQLEQPQNILEIGTGFGLSATGWIRGAGQSLKNFISLDLGIYGVSFAWRNSLVFVEQGLEQLKQIHNLNFQLELFKVNTQPNLKFLDEEDARVKKKIDCLYWKDNKKLFLLLQNLRFELIFIDGQHSADGLYNDLNSFIPFAKSGTLIVCDDLQMESVKSSFFRFIGENEIKKFFVWDFLGTDTQKRIQGLIRV